MQQVLSTYRFIHHALTPALLGEIAAAGIREIEIFCASGHFSYASPQTVRETASALTDRQITLHSLHSPTERDMAPGRESGTPISISDTERIRRLDAIDEVKRALEVAERIPFRYLIQHIGHGRQVADPRKLDAAFSSIEHLSLFARQRGVTIALENTPGDLGSPETLQQFLKETHLQSVKFCLDTGHAHMESTVGGSFEFMRERLATTHIHDNHGEKDEHLLPGNGTIDWDGVLKMFAGAPEPLPLVLELKDQPGDAPSLGQIRAAFERLATSQAKLDSAKGSQAGK